MSQVSVAVSIDEIATEEDSIPGLDDIADAIGPGEDELVKAENLPFGIRCKSGSYRIVFAVWSWLVSNNVTEVAIPSHESYSLLKKTPQGSRLQNSCRKHQNNGYR